MSKKFNDWVRPGVEEVRARPCTRSRELMRLDLPTFERPRKAISGFESRGQSSSLNALLRNSAVTTFIDKLATDLTDDPWPFQLVACGGSLCGGALLVKLDDLLYALTNGHESRFVVRDPLHNFLEVREIIGVAGLCSQRFQERLHLRINKDVLAVSVVEHLLIDRAVVDERARHVPVRNNHPIKTALIAGKYIRKIFWRLRVEHKKPIARFAHRLLATEVVKLQNKFCIVMFTHFKVLLWNLAADYTDGIGNISWSEFLAKAAR